MGKDQIEKMAKVIGDTWLVDLEGETKGVCEVLDEVDIKAIARELYEQDYRKVPEDSVVLSREEYIDLSRNYVGEQVAQARKETAEEILDLLVPDCKACDENWHSGCLCLRATLAEKIAKQFGVEVEK